MTKVSYDCYSKGGNLIHEDIATLDEAKAIANNLEGYYKTRYTDIGDKSFEEDLIKKGV